MALKGGHTMGDEKRSQCAVVFIFGLLVDCYVVCHASSVVGRFVGGFNPDKTVSG